MRYYGFGNYYLSSIQQGIQAAHCIADMSFAYTLEPTDRHGIYIEWARYHKTMILLNGGNSRDLQYLAEELTDIGKSLELPCTSFREDTNSINGAYTHVGIVVPEYIYTLSSLLRSGSVTAQEVLDAGGYLTNINNGVQIFTEVLNEFALNLAILLNKYQLAK